MSNAAVSKRYTWTGWFLGLLADLVLYALFLVMGVAVLNILIATIVLGVGIVRGGQEKFEVREGGSGIELVEGEKEERLGRDSIDLVKAVVIAGVAVAAFRAYNRLRRRYLHLFGDPAYELVVSKRYLIAREGGRLVGLITSISVLGVAVGVMALIVVISVMEGFDQTLVRKFMGVFSHMTIMPHPRLSDSPIIPGQTTDELIAFLEEQDFVEGAAPIYEHRTLIMREPGSFDGAAYAQIRGLDPARERSVTEFLSYIKDGKAEPGKNEVVLGHSLARKLRVGVGDTIYAIGKIAPTANRIATKTQPLEVVGVFQSGLYEVDDGFAYTDLDTMRRMLVVDDGVTAIHVKIDDPDHAGDPRYLIPVYKNIPRNYFVYTWQDLNPEFFEALWMEKVAMFIILLLIVLVASFNIVGTLVMTVVQKTRDIGVLKSMGATRMGIMKIFLLHGFLVGLMGTSLGVAWGLRICQFVDQDIEKIFKLPAGVYGIDRLPVVVEPVLIISIALSAMVICIGASIVPALQAARLNPVEALRYD